MHQVLSAFPSLTQRLGSPSPYIKSELAQQFSQEYTPSAFSVIRLTISPHLSIPSPNSPNIIFENIHFPPF